MKSDKHWPMVPIKDVCIGIYDGPHATPAPSEKGGIFLGISNFVNGRLDLSDIRYISDDDMPKWTKRVMPQAHDIVFSYEATLNLYAIIPDNFYGCLGRRMALMRPNPDIIDYRYLYYYMYSDAWREVIHKHIVRGSTVDRIPLIHFPDFPIALPDLATQREMISVLAAIDEKIELNNQINENLQQQAQAIYQHMFGITEDRPANGVLSDICSLSTEKVDVSKLGLENYYSTENMLPNKGGAVVAIALPSIAQTTKSRPGDTLISNIRPYFKKILYCTKEGGCSTDVLCFRPKRPELAAFLYNTLYNDRFFDYMMAGAKGTKMPRGDKQQMLNYSIYLPHKDGLSSFAEFSSGILCYMNNANIENGYLRIMRDGLLDKLII